MFLEDQIGRMMRRRSPTFLLLFALGLAVIGCAKQEVAPPPGPTPEPASAARSLEATVSALNIIDERRGVAAPDRRLHMPNTTIVGQKDRIAPALSDGDEALIDEEIRSRFVPGNREVTVDVYVLDGSESFEVGEMRETVEVHFKVRIEVADIQNVSDVRIGEGEARRTEEDVDVAPELVPSLFANVIRESLRRALDRIAGR